MTILITGTAGFIGAATAEFLLQRGEQVHGVDNLNDYYDVGLKSARLERLRVFPAFTFDRMDIVHRGELERLFREQEPDVVLHLAAHPGVRDSLENFDVHIQSNLVGFANVLDGCRAVAVKHLVFASSGAVYGANADMPFSEHHGTDHPLSLYAAAKKANEILAHSYAHLYQLPCTGLRFFNVYGPWDKPGMALFSFTRAMLSGHAIDVFNHGDMQRDFIYIDDLVEGIAKVIRHVPIPDNGGASRPAQAISNAPYKIYNMGNNHPEPLTDLIACLENALDKKAIKNLLPMQAGEVPVTFADMTDFERDIGSKPATPLKEGVRRFVAWYKEYYGV